MARVAKEIGSQSLPLAEEMTLTNAELFLGDRRRAYENLGKRTGLATVKSVVTSLIQSERYGTPLGTALRVLAQENRDTRMSEAEKRAAALPQADGADGTVLSAGDLHRALGPGRYPGVREVRQWQ